MGIIGSLYRRIWGMIFHKPTNFSWLIEGKLAGSGYPTSKRELDWLKEQGIRAILSLTERPLPDKWIQNSDFNYLHIPIPNKRATSIEEIHRAVKFIKSQISNGLPVLVHCAAGQGRTGMILAAYFVNTSSMKPDEAIKFIRRVRPGSVENVEQVEAVHKYYEMLKYLDSDDQSRR
ncbi:MAG: dual specificity protein phosphatase 23 [Nitrososphaerales archaeon]|nr:dual specificity protein phosphatase 23 [Nitrososphaerales archaeon]